MTVLCAYLIVRTLESNDPATVILIIEVCALIVSVVRMDLSHSREQGRLSMTPQESSEEP
jgi:hypothetical protein